MRRLPRTLAAAVLFGLNLAAPGRADELAYGVNSQDETVSIFNLTTGEVRPNVLVTGETPGSIFVRGDRAFIVNSADNNVQVVNLRTNATEQFIPTGDGSNPWDIAFGPDGRGYVTNLRTHEVIAVDLETGATLNRIPVGGAPEGLAFARGKLYVANTGFVRFDGELGRSIYDPGTISVIDPGTGSVVDEIAVGLNPQYVVPDPQGNVLVAQTGDFAETFGSIGVIDTSTDAVVATVPIEAFPGRIAVTPEGKAYVTVFKPDFTSAVVVFDARSRTFVRGPGDPIEGIAAAFFAAVAPTSGHVIVAGSNFFDVNKLYVIDPQTDAVIGEFDGGVGLSSVAVYDPERPTAVAEIPSPELPARFELGPGFPNPFNPTVTLSFALPGPGAASVRLAVFDARGARVAELVDDRLRAGLYRAVWDGRDEGGRPVASGVYLIRMETDGFGATRAVTLAR